MGRSVDADEGAIPSGVAFSDLVYSARRVYLLAGGVPTEDLGDDDAARDLDGWAAVVSVLVALLRGSEGSDDVVPYARLADTAYKAYNAGLSEPAPLPFESVPGAERVGFEAATRHVLGAYDCDPEDAADLRSHELFWREWGATRRATLTGEVHAA